MISKTLLESYGAQMVDVKRKEVLFTIGTTPKFYFQVESGRVKMNNFNEDGKEFIQGIFSKGMGFGEPPLLAHVAYPAYAEAIEDSRIWRLSKDAFFSLLHENPEYHLKLTKALARRLHYKATMVAEISSESAEHRILRLIDYFKEHVHKIPEGREYVVEFSRQRLADLTGLRVETVIRAVKNLENQGELKRKDRKIIR